MNELDIQRSDDSGLRELALFAGAGGGILGGTLLGWRTVCAVERDGYAAQVLAQRQNDGILSPFPIWSDVCNFDGRPWRGIVDVISGGFPCQDISVAGKGAGITEARSGLWKEMARIIGEVQPSYVFVENSPMLTSRGLGTVLGDLASLRFDAEWGVLSAADVGAPHLRERIWILAKQRDIFSHSEHHGDGWRKQQQEGVEKKNTDLSDTISIGRDARRRDDREYDWSITDTGGQHNGEISNSSGIGQQGQGQPIQQMCPAENCNKQANILEPIGQSSQWSVEPDVGRVANRVAARVDRLKAIGNGQVPLVAATAFNLLLERIKQNE